MASRILAALGLCLATHATAQEVGLDAALAEDRNAVVDVQSHLIAMGLLSGRADGAFGPASRAALTEWFARFAPGDTVLDAAGAARLAATAANASTSPWDDPATAFPFDPNIVETNFDLRDRHPLCAELECFAYTVVLATGDMTGDGLPEIVVQMFVQSRDGEDINAPNPIVVLSPRFRGRFDLLEVASDRPEGIGRVHPRDAVITDLNGDGLGDLFIATHGWDYHPFPGEQSVLVLTGPDGLTDASHTHLPIVDDFAHGVAHADLDGDGDQDLVVVTHGIRGQDSYVLWNDGTGMFTSAGLDTILSESLALHFSDGMDLARYSDLDIVDIDGDGHLDLLLRVGGFNADQVAGKSGMRRTRIVWGDGSGQWTRDNAQELPVARWGDMTFAAAAGIADMDGDGDLDLVLGTTTVDGTAQGASNWTGHYLQVLRNDGERQFSDITAETIFTQGYPEGKITFPWSVELADLDDDGQMDIVVGSIDDWAPCQFARPVPAKLALLGLSETGTTKLRAVDPVGIVPEGCNNMANLRALDVDGDGDFDLVGTRRENTDAPDGGVVSIGVGVQVMLRR